MMTRGFNLSSWSVLYFVGSYLRPLPTNHKINPTTNTTNKIPTHMPALKMPPTTSQDDNVIAVANTNSPNKEYCFMSSSFWGILQKLCRLSIIDRCCSRINICWPVEIPFFCNRKILLFIVEPN